MRLCLVRCAVVAVLFFAAGSALAQCGSVDQTTEKATISGNAITITWSPFAGATASTQYVVFGYSAPSYCGTLNFDDARLRSNPTAGNSFTTVPLPSGVYFFAVEVVGCSDPTYSGPQVELFDAPGPATLSATRGQNNEAIFAISVPDDHAAGAIIQRANPDGTYPDLPGCVGCTSPETYAYNSNIERFAYAAVGSICPPGSILTDPNHPLRFLRGGLNTFRACSFHVVQGHGDFVCGASVTVLGSDTASIDTAGQFRFLEGSSNPASLVLTRFDEAASGAATISLASSDASVLTVPASLTISGGASSVSFTIAARHAGKATITATTPWGTTTTSNIITVAKSAIFTPLATPAPIAVSANGGTATTTFTITNSGSISGSADLSVLLGAPSVDVSPKTITLAPGEIQTVTISGGPVTAAAGTVVPVAIRILANALNAQPVDVNTSLLVVAAPTVTPPPVTVTRRIDVVAPIDATPPAVQVTFDNPGPSAITGTVVSDAAWLIPTQPLLTIPANGSAVAQLTIDRSKRPDGAAPLGSAIATVSFVYAVSASGAKALDSAQTASVTVRVVDTATVRTVQSTLTPLTGDQLALIVPGIGHTQGSVGLFISDLALLNRLPSKELRNLQLFYTPPGSPTFLATIPQLLPLHPVLFSDVVKNLFNVEGSAGSMQIRFSDLESLTAAASVFNSSNARGTYGTGIPILRSDRAARPGESLNLVGLRADEQSHTNVYLQEMTGGTATISSRFLAANGSVLTERTDTIGPFAVQFLGSVVPRGAVSAVLTHAGGNGTFLAYATPVDASGDTWAVVDWRRQFGVADATSLIIPTAGALHGANGTYYRTDVAVMNTGTISLAGTLRFSDRNGMSNEKQLSLAPGETFTSADVVSTYFGISTDDAGFITFTATSPSFAMTSRTFTNSADGPGSYGTAVPALAPAFAISSGQTREITGISESAFTSIRLGKPATFRTNFGLVETTGNAATVRVTLRFSYPAGTNTTATAESIREYSLGPFEYAQRGVKELLGPAAESLGDLSVAAIEFEVIGGTGRVLPYVSSVDNGTGDSVLRVE